MNTLIILKIIFLFLAVLYGYSNTAKVFRKQGVSDFQMLFMAIGIVGFVIIQFKLYL